jgi:DNA-binding CsgD family transcriptional regulator/DNA-binding MarR family transcriptional regulator
MTDDVAPPFLVAHSRHVGDRTGGVVLEAVGVAPTDEEIYRALLRAPRSSPTEIAHLVDRDQALVQQSIEHLESLGLVSRSPGAEALVPIRPDVAVDVLVARQRAELDQAQAAARTLLSELQTSEQHRPENLVEVIVGRSMIAARFDQLLGETRHDLRVLDRPPYAAPSGKSDPTVRRLMNEGVRVHGIYSPDSLDRPGAVDEAFSAALAGETSRVHPKVPMKLAIFDESAALLPLSVDQLIDSALVVHPCSLLDALVEMFTLLWGQALPMVAAGMVESEGQTLDARLMTMLAAGMKDDAIARQLAISSRTVGRRVAELMTRLGARTRFQAAIYAQRRGLLEK